MMRSKIETYVIYLNLSALLIVTGAVIVWLLLTVLATDQQTAGQPVIVTGMPDRYVAASSPARLTDGEFGYITSTSLCLDPHRQLWIDPQAALDRQYSRAYGTFIRIAVVNGSLVAYSQTFNHPD